MKYSQNVFTVLISLVLLMVVTIDSNSQTPVIKFGEAVILRDITPASQVKNIPLNWINVNTDETTWSKQKNILICSGKPIGVMRSEKQYENFILHIEWKHIEPGGNSGVFVWSGADPAEESRLPDGVEVQMLELDWVNLNTKDGVVPPVAYVHGELFGVGGVQTVPDNPRGTRSKSVENRCLGRDSWNIYDVICVDGVIKLSVNGKFVNGISRSSKSKGYLCLESEGAEIHFRNIKIVELPAGLASE
jgi:hypothetical protein